MTVDEAIKSLQKLSQEGYGELPLLDVKDETIVDFVLDEDAFSKVWVWN